MCRTISKLVSFQARIQKTCSGLRTLTKIININKRSVVSRDNIYDFRRLDQRNNSYEHVSPHLFPVVVDVHAAHVNVSGRVLDVSGQHLERGRLAGSVRAQKAETLVGLQGQVQSLHRVFVPVFLPDVAAETNVFDVRHIV